MPMVARESARTLPDPSAELVLIAATLKVFLKTMPRKKDRLDFLKAVSDEMRWEMEGALVLRIREAASDKEVAAARAQAAEWWSRISERLAELAR
jgi:hypothetical protein